jgi:hypothetical protein
MLDYRQILFLAVQHAACVAVLVGLLESGACVHHVYFGVRLWFALTHLG